MSPRDAERVRLARAAMEALARGDGPSARRFAEDLLAADPKDANANQVIGLLALEAGDLATAKARLERANAAAPNQPRILNSLGVALRRSGETDAARRAFARAGELGLAEGWRNLGGLEALAGNAAASVTAYEKAVALNEADAVAHAGLAQGLEQRHELARARSHAERALALDPNNEVARLALAQVLMRERAFGEAELAATRVAEAGASATNRALAWGLIGETRDRRGDAPGAFRAFTAANQLLLTQHGHFLTQTEMPYHPEGVRRMRAFVEAEDFASWSTPASFQTPAPAFIVGFPRSGTTLLDQILSSHPRIVCLEEREILANASADLLTGAGLARISVMANAEIQRRRRDYWKRARALLSEPPGERTLVDKLPLNIVFLPLVKRLFPDAKVIFALRDPRDVILSCYQQRFGMNAAMVQFLNLETATSYYDAVMGLFERSREKLGLSMHTVRYEDVVRDLEAAARGLCAFLELPFDPAMTRFDATARQREINTPSARQVIEPVYARSVGRWRGYKEELALVLPRLEAWARRLGYER